VIRRTLPALGALLLVLGTAACGGGDGDADSADDPPRDTDDASARSADEGGASASGGTLPSAEDEAAASDLPAETEGDTPASSAPPAPGEPGAVATQLGVDRVFTGAGSGELCDEMAAVQAGAAPDLTNSQLADQMAAITPPPEIATEWELMHTVTKTIAADRSGTALADLSQEQAEDFATASNVVAAYLGDVCGLR
jgi:hypothetical protein